MEKIVLSNEYFNIYDTLSCGQLFRFMPYLNGYKVFSMDKCAFCYEEEKNSVIVCEKEDVEYFKNYFDLSRNYNVIVESAKKENEILSKVALFGKGIRILNQDSVEALFSFIVSQNNNIPRIKGIIERLCKALGKEKYFNGEKYYAFPTAKDMAKKDVNFYMSLGLGYRASYIMRLAQEIDKGLNIYDFNSLSTEDLRKKLISIYGVGPKVADCVVLFGFHRSNAFPVDTWIEKVYREDFNGTLKDRNKIAEYFTKRFKENSGYYQQYLFYYKRSLEEKKGN